MFFFFCFVFFAVHYFGGSVGVGSLFCNVVSFLVLQLSKKERVCFLSLPCIAIM